jgi:hypothetical protein
MVGSEHEEAVHVLTSHAGVGRETHAGIGTVEPRTDRFEAFVRSYCGVSTPWLNSAAQRRFNRLASDDVGLPAGR